MTPVLSAAAAVLPTEPGVYRFRDAAGRVFYLGRAITPRSRVRSYSGDLRDRRHLRRMVPQIAAVEALVCASVHEASWLERNLLERSLPRWNRVRGGAEVPCRLGLRAVLAGAPEGLEAYRARRPGPLPPEPYLGFARRSAELAVAPRATRWGRRSRRPGRRW